MFPQFQRAPLPPSGRGRTKMEAGSQERLSDGNILTLLACLGRLRQVIKRSGKPCVSDWEKGTWIEYQKYPTLIKQRMQETELKSLNDRKFTTPTVKPPSRCRTRIVACSGFAGQAVLCARILGCRSPRFTTDRKFALCVLHFSIQYICKRLHRECHNPGSSDWLSTVRCVTSRPRWLRRLVSLPRLPHLASSLSFVQFRLGLGEWWRRFLKLVESPS